MDIKVAVAAALLMAAVAQGKSGAERQVTVYLPNDTIVPLVVRAQAEARASEMFAGIGVRLNVREGRPPVAETTTIIIDLIDNTPAEFLPRALAYALPYEGVHIRIFWDRLRLARSPETLLAHVMVHEITHILQGVARHSAEGIMNARWTNQELIAMARKPLHFTEEDVELIYQGMDARDARRAGQALAAMSPKVASFPPYRKPGAAGLRPSPGIPNCGPGFDSGDRRNRCSPSSWKWTWIIRTGHVPGDASDLEDDSIGGNEAV